MNEKIDIILYIILGFALGVIVSLFGAGQSLSDYRIRIEKLREDTAGLQQTASRLQSINSQIKRELATERETNQRITDRISSLERENELQRAFIKSIERANSKFAANNTEFGAILKAIRQRGAIQNSQVKN